MNLTRVFYRNLGSDKRIKCNEGGTSSSKTYSILQVLVVKAVKYPNIIISVVSESIPHLKLGAIRDFKAMLTEEGIWDENKFNLTDRIYTFDSGSKIEFFSADNPGKVHGPRRDILFLNEAVNIPYQVYDQLAIRTKSEEYLDWNPTQEFWAHEHLQGDPECEWIRSTYLDNDWLPDSIKQRIEAKKDKDPNWWRVYGLGIVGKVEGLIFPVFEIIDEFPDVSHFYGMDFGYTNDPTAMIRIGLQGEDLYLDEGIYETGLTNQDIAARLRMIGIRPKMDELFADSAEPKSIEEIYREGFNIKGAIKGKDSILNGIDIIKRFKIHITKNSVNTIKEFRNYRWIEDKNGNLTNKPIDDFNHAIDAIRYGVLMKVHRPRRQMVY